MFKLDNAFLEELGLGSLPAVEKNKMLAHIYETLETRVGVRLAEQMTNEQLDEFEAYINRQDEAGALSWLEANFPNYKQVVAEELEKLKNEVRQVAPHIVAQAAQAAQAMPAAHPSQSPPEPGYQQPPLPTAPPQPQSYQQPVHPAANAYTNQQQPQPSYQQPAQMPPQQPQSPPVQMPPSTYPQPDPYAAQPQEPTNNQQPYSNGQ